MLSKRIIPCLDIKDGRTVKGVNFISLKDAGDPVALARRYSEMGADELVLLDITATHEGRKTFADVVTRVAEEVNIPFTVGGGISTVEDVERMLSAGADKVSINSSALKTPTLINDITRHFGSQVCVVAIDGRDGIAYTHGGRVSTGRNIMDWAKECADRGAGEILYTSMNHDGTKQGFDNERLRLMSEQLPIPVIASGGAGSMQHFADAFIIGKADAALAASVFHYGEIAIPELKKFLINDNIPIRL